MAAFDTNRRLQDLSFLQRSFPGARPCHVFCVAGTGPARRWWAANSLEKIRPCARL